MDSIFAPLFSPSPITNLFPPRQPFAFLSVLRHRTLHRFHPPLCLFHHPSPFPQLLARTQDTSNPRRKAPAATTLSIPMANTNRNGLSDHLSSAELGQGRPSLDENSNNSTDRTALLGKQRRPSGNGGPNANGYVNNNTNGNKRPAKTSISGHARKRIIIALTSISGLLLIVLAVALFKKIGSAPSKSLFRCIQGREYGPVANRSVRWPCARTLICKDRH